MKKRVLIVDDEAGLRDVLADRFIQDGWEAVKAADGREALASCREGTFNLILLDLQMPNMNGLEFLAEAKKDPACANAPIVILTVSASGEDIKRAMALGARDYFVKSHDSIEKIIQWANAYAA